MCKIRKYQIWVDATVFSAKFLQAFVNFANPPKFEDKIHDCKILQGLIKVQ